METFKVVAKIRYKENSFYVLINKFCQKYFIKEFDDGTIMYPTVEEYQELYSIFAEKQELIMLRPFKDYKIVPKVISKGGKVIALGVIVATIGIAFPMIVNAPADTLSIISQNGDESRLEDIYRKVGYDFHSLYGYEKQRLYRIHQYIISNKELRVTECQDFEEFSKYISTKNNPTYDELRETLVGNPNIESKYKEWLLDGISNLEKSMPNANLTVLNFNMSRLQLEEITSEKINEGDNEALAGRFDSKTGKAYFVDLGNEESNKFVVFHEVLGHGMSEASFEKYVDYNFQYVDTLNMKLHISNEKIIISDSIFVMKCFDEDNEFGKNYDFFYVGQGLEEGKADQIAKMAMGDKRVVGSPYIEQSEQLRILRETVGLSFEDYISQGGAEILNQKMQENDVGNSLAYIYASDMYVSAMKSANIDLIDKKYTFKENVLAFFRDYADNKIKNGEDRKKIVIAFSKILEEGGEYIHSTFSSEEINYSDLEEKVEDTVQMIGKEEDNQEREK